MADNRRTVRRDLWEYDRHAYERRRKTREENKRDRNTLLFVYAVIVWALATVILFALSQTEEEPAEPIATSPAGIVLERPVYLDSQAIHKEAQEPVQEPLYTPEELDALALGIYQEAGGDACGDDTRQMVGEVVLNRVADERFPNTIQEVLTAPRQYGRLHWTGLVWPDRAEHEPEAVERAYQCAEALLNGAERLLPEDAVWQAEFPQGREVLEVQDGLYFCR